MAQSPEAADAATNGAAAAPADKASAPVKAAEPAPAAVATTEAGAPGKRTGARSAARMRYAAVAATALAVGTTFGMVAAPRGHGADTLVRIEAALDGQRAGQARASEEIERLAKTVAALREAGDAARGEQRSAAAGLGDRLTKLDKGVDARLTALTETVERTGREQAARLGAVTAQVEKRASAPAATHVAASVAPAPAARPEPTQTASITEARPKPDATKPDATKPDTIRPEPVKAETPKPETVEGWALREVFGGVAILEDRRHRLYEVARGGSVPGVGRVEGIERRGRTWVVVTRQGLITPQPW